MAFREVLLPFFVVNILLDDVFYGLMVAAA